AVVTVPAYFNDAQRQATSDAGRIAGLNVMRMLNEPTAAALAYGLKQEGLVQTVAVYDLGGGTFDVTVLRVGDGAIEVVATGGDKNLGGFDWDNCLMNYLNDSFKASGGTDLFDDPRFEAELRSKCELAKKTLSTRDKAIVPMSFAGKAITAHVTREDFERITKPLLKRTLNIMDLVLDDANLDWNEINRILLVGGSTRMTAVPHAIEQHTRAKPSRELHPDEVVAFGAAVQAAMCGQHGGTLVPILANLPVRKVVDVNSHSLGVIALNESDQEHNSIILRKNTSIPCAASDVFQTITDNQEQIRIRVTQGEDDDPAYVHIVGEAEITLPKYPKGAPLEVFFSYDVSGLIRVSVKDLTADRMLEQNFSVLVRNENLAPEVVEQKRVDLAKVTVN
ncbi:MAG: Hsp70 family protein, partial [Limisphaerales bacterium]